MLAVGPDQLRIMHQCAPLVAAVISAFSHWHAHGFHYHVWRDFWEHLAKTAVHSAQGFDAGPPLPVAGAASWNSDACVSSGICSALPRVRERHPTEMDTGGSAEGAAPGSCRHLFVRRSHVTGGVFTLLCPHGVVYAFFIIDRAEGRDELYSFLVQHFQSAPRVVIYDFACAAHEFALNRAPAFFARTQFVVDRFHWRGHSACSEGYSMDHYERLRGLNSQAAEQSNSRMVRLKGMASSMKQETYMRVLRFVYSCQNAQAITEVQQGMRRVRA